MREMTVSRLAYAMLEKAGMENEAKTAIFNEAQQVYSDIETAQTKAKEAINAIKNADEGIKQFNGWNRIYGNEAEKMIEKQIKNNWGTLAGITRIPGKQKTIPYSWLASVRQTLDDPDRLGTFSSTVQKTPRKVTKSLSTTRKHQKYVIPYAWVLNNMFDPNFENKLASRWDEAFWEDMADLAWNGTANTGTSFYTLQKGFIPIMKATGDTVTTPEGDSVVYSWGADEMTVNKVDASAASTAWTYATMSSDIDKTIRAMKANPKTRHYLNKGGYMIMMSDNNAETFNQGRTDAVASSVGVNTDTREKVLASGEYMPYRGYPVVGMPYFPDDAIIFARISDFVMGYQTDVMVSYERKAELTAEDAVIAGEGAGSPGLVVNKNYYTDLNIVNPDAMAIIYDNAKCETPKAFDSAKNVASVVTAGTGAGALTVYPFCATPDCELYADDATISDTYATAVANATLVEKGSSYTIADEGTGYFKAFRNGIALPSTQLTVVNES